MAPASQPPLDRSSASLIVPFPSWDTVLSNVAPGAKFAAERLVPFAEMVIDTGPAPAPSNGEPPVAASHVARSASSAGPEVMGVSDGGVESAGTGVAVAS